MANNTGKRKKTNKNTGPKSTIKRQDKSAENIVEIRNDIIVIGIILSSNKIFQPTTSKAANFKNNIVPKTIAIMSTIAQHIINVNLCLFRIS